MSGKITGEEPTVAVSADSAVGDEAGSTPSIPAGSTPLRHVFANRYEILGLVGSGGMGTVYRARDRELDEVVALKLLRREVMDSPGILDRFRQEVKLARRVTHRNVARTYDIGESEGEKFLTMEFVEGEALAARIAREGPQSFDVVMDLAEGICAGLQAAHGAGVVHRDLKPDNVLLARDGRVVLTDFGIARALADAGRAATVGLALGTPAYMAPEQVEGATDLDERADVYALGAMLYELVTGQRAWQGDGIWAVASARLFKPPPDPRTKRPDLPPAAAEIIVRCMARRREDRFASVAEITRALSSMTMPARQPRPSSPPPGATALEADAKAVAVLPFRNQGAPADEYLADGLSDDLIDALSMTAGLRVLARGAVARYRGEARDAREVGRDLRVQVVVDGSVRRAGDLLRVSTRVVSVADGFQLWAKRFDRPEKEILSVSDEAANAIAEALTLHRSAPMRAAPTDPRALDLYLRARQMFRRGWRDAVLESLGLFQQALALAPDDPTILAGYARAELRRFMFDTETHDAAESERKGRAAAERALAIAPRLPEARAALANLHWAMGDHVAAAREIRESLRVAPSSSDVNELCGRMLLEVGAPERAVAVLAAVAALDPSVDVAGTDLLRGRELLGDTSAFEGALAHDPEGEAASLHFFQLARLAIWRRDPVAARAVRARMGDRTFALRNEVLGLLEMAETGKAPPGVHQALAFWGQAVGRARRRPIFFRQLAAEVHAFLGQDADAVAAVTAADAIGLIDVTWADRCALFAGMRAAGPFAAVRDRIASRAKEALDVLEGRAD
ncbi:MAG TPA: serine/threonine-protein kinase [Polyangiaceae bacterium]|jgi:serine/threonine-protein kinase